MDKLKIITAFQIKILLIALMLLSHLHYISGLMSPEAASVINIISRCVAPMFAYLAVEGIRYTHNLKKYCLRLSVFAAVMFIGNAILRILYQNIRGVLTDNVRLLLLNNIFFTLALGVLAIALIKWGKDKRTLSGKLLYVLSAICFLFGFLYGEWGTVIIPFMFLEYFFSEQKFIRLLGYVVIEVIAILLPFSEPLWFFVFPLIFLYNGERGLKTKFSKYFFYIFYVTHLWMIAIINIFVIR